MKVVIPSIAVVAVLTSLCAVGPAAAAPADAKVAFKKDAQFIEESAGWSDPQRVGQATQERS